MSMIHGHIVFGDFQSYNGVITEIGMHMGTIYTKKYNGPKAGGY